jgi:hypothetical protein
MKNRYFKNCHHLSPALALLGMATLATPVAAVPTLDMLAGAYAGLFSNGVKYDQIGGSTQQLADGSYITRKGCTPSSSNPGNPAQLTGDCFAFDPALVPAPTHWYQRPNNYTYAASQIYTNYGVNKARSWSTGITGSLYPGEENLQFVYVGEALSEYREEISYFGAAPTPVTFNLRLHAAWNDSGRFSLAIGRPFDNPDGTNYADAVYDNCAPMSTSCAGRYEPSLSSNQFYVAGNDAANTNGMVDQLISFTMMLNAYDPLAEFISPINPFMVSLHTFAYGSGAEIDAFNTVTLDSIIVQPGVSLTFGSGTRYNVRVAGDPAVPPNGVPEPGAPLLLLTGLAAMWGTRRMRK